MCPSVHSVWAQVDSVTVQKVSIINAKHKVEGIYKTFDEFIRNTPFYTGAFKVVLFNRSENVMVNRWNDEIVYYNKKDKVKQKGSQKFFGYCKSDSVYVSIKYLYFGFKSVSFCPIIEFGHLSVVRFNRKIGTPTGGGKAMFATPMGPGPAIVEDVPFERLYVLDFTTGEIFRLSYALVKNKLKVRDKKLFQQLVSTKDKKEYASPRECTS
jgi:hypothetical protein